jgi:hypothetical protein
MVEFNICMKITLRKLTVNALIVIVLAAVAVSAIMLFFPRSLWWDEAALADNIVVRDLQNLLGTPLDNGQTAPALYLVAVKLSGVAFGYTETSLRLVSFLAFLWMLLMIFLLLRDSFRTDRLFVWTGVAIAATLSIFLRYSTELKQYMVETAAVMTVVYAFRRYWNKHFNISILSLLYIILIFLSNNVIFFIASSYIAIIIFKIKTRKISEATSVAAHGAVVATVFAIYYLLWLSVVANSDYMQNYWDSSAFRFAPVDLDGFCRNELLLINLFKEMNPAVIVRLLIIALSVAGFLVSLRRGSWISATVGLAFAFFFIASHFYLAPIACRLCLFFYVFAIIYIVVFLEFCASALKRFVWAKYAFATIAIALFFNNINFINNIHYVYPDDNTKPLLKYVREHIREDETLYSYLCSNHAVRFDTGYSDHIGASRREIIYGQNIYDWFGGEFDRKMETEATVNPWEMVWDYGYDWDYPNEIERVIAAGKAYLLFSHLIDSDVDAWTGYGLARLNEVGRVVKIMEINRTLLYYFSTETQSVIKKRSFRVPF